MSEKILHAFWDFNINPISYDIVWFLCASEHYSLVNGYDSFMVHFIPEKNEELREYPKEFNKVIDFASRENWLYRFYFPSNTKLYIVLFFNETSE